ncbi:MAG: hypothetical protein GXC94_00385 [Comamonadaceae bacterium]|nr:hypothetical protein [Comamonadaceae bacterium]
MKPAWVLAPAAGQSQAPLHPASDVHAGRAQATGSQGGSLLRVTSPSPTLPPWRGG